MRDMFIMKIVKLKLIVILLFSIGCFNKSETTNTQSIFQNLTDKVTTFFGLQDEPAPNYMSPSILHFNQVLQNMETVTGVVADANLRNYYKNKTDILSTNGDPDSVTAPMWLAITEISSRMCNALVEKEAGLAPEERLFFNNVDFTRAPSNISQSNRDLIVRKISRSFWGRNETDAEKLDLLNGFNEVNVNETNPKVGLKALCTIMLSALPAQDS